MLKKAILLAAVAVSLASAQKPTTVIVVRHAEKAAEPAADPPLNGAGLVRAASLAQMVRDMGVEAVITTQFARTRSTAAPLLESLKLTGEVVDARAPMHAKLVADSVMMKHRGQTVLVVGHSNTVPDIIAALGAPNPGPICDDGYDNLFIVTVPSSGSATVARLHYGVTTACTQK
jgi:broad specificity phosphatase PhoE